MLKVKVGCDPEVFVRNPNSQQFRCAHNMVPGTKEEPFRVPYGAVQVDGMALEFNILPVTEADKFVRNVTKVYNKLGRMVPGYELVPVPTAQFTDEEYNSAPAVAKILGCEPDYNAYTEATNPRPNGEVTFRTGSGHVHIGWTEGADPMSPAHFKDCCTLVKELDWTLGLQATLYDTDKQRRQLYGKAGAFRPKPYGVEYRVLSNAWLQSEDLMRWVFETTVATVQMLEQASRPVLEGLYPSSAQMAIDGGPYSLAPSTVLGYAKPYFEKYGIKPPPVPAVKRKKAA
jgi:hypothetical protein